MSCRSILKKLLFQRVITQDEYDKLERNLQKVPPGRPVIFSPGSGEWVLEEDRRNHWHCSVCGTVFGIVSQTYQYCPHCGSYMTNPLYPFDPFRVEGEDDDEHTD